MKNFITKFSTTSEYEAATLDFPNVSLTKDDNVVHYMFSDRFNGHEYVDLGLPSGTLWATMNVGANSVTDYGLYFAWGETTGYGADQVSGSATPHKDFSWADYELSTNGVDINTPNINKYNNNASYGYNGYTDSLIILEASDDAATVNWGGEWHMPSPEQYQELIDNTTYAWTTDYNGSDVAGTTFTANGNTLFIPAAGGYNDNDGNANDAQNYYGLILSSMIYPNNPRTAWAMYFEADDLTIVNGNRCYGSNVRGVVGEITLSQSEDPTEPIEEPIK